jgi:hypothetical protein
LKAFERKYATLSELAPVRTAIAEFVAIASSAQPKKAKAKKRGAKTVAARQAA